MTQITNAKSPTIKPPIFGLVGPPGSGKTTQFLTFPKPALAILFDPNAATALRGHDIDIAEFYADNVSLALRTGKKRSGETYGEPQAYHNFSAWFNSMLESDGFAKYASIMLDSWTTLEGLIMDGILYDRGLLHAAPEKNEYTLARQNGVFVLRSFTALRKNLLVIAHQKDKVNQGGAVIGIEINATGALRYGGWTSAMSDVFFTFVKGDSRGQTFMAQTRSGGMITDAETSIPGLDFQIDITIKDMKRPEKYGIGALIAKM